MNNTMPPSGEVTNGLSQGQIGVLQDQLGHGLRKTTVFQKTPTAEVDRFVKEIGLSFRGVSVEWLEKRFQDFIGMFPVPVNYGEPEAIAKAIEEAGFDSKFIGIPLADIPLIGSGQFTHEVREVHFGRVMYNRDLPQALKDRGQQLGFKAGFKLADPLTALRFACANKDRQRKHPLAILFTDNTGQLCYLCLDESAGKRYLDIDRDGPDDFWRNRVRFLAVCELPLAV